MIKFYKNMMKIKYERNLSEQIEYNIKRKELYNNICPEKYEYLRATSQSICKCYDEEVLHRIHKKYNIDKELIDKADKASEDALEAYDDMIVKYEDMKLEEEKAEKVNLYKKAILELKSEGRL